eukprot:182034_1
MSDSTSSKWIQLASHPQAHWKISQLVRINNKTFATFKSDPVHAVKYNTDPDKWEDYTQSLIQKGNSITSAFDMKNEILYIQCQSCMIEINIKTNKTKVTKNIQSIGYGARAIIINNKYNVIGGSTNTKHLIWNGEIFEEQYNFNTSWSGLYRCEVLQISSKNVLCLGGYYICHGSGLSDSIFSYDIASNKWIKLSQTLPEGVSSFGCVVSKGNKYMIILGGYDRDIIHVLDLKMMIFRQISIRTPSKGYFTAINMYDKNNEDLLSFGYIRKFCDNLNIPFYLMKIVGKYYSNEWIYLMENYGNHWKIKLDDILNDQPDFLHA